MGLLKTSKTSCRYCLKVPYSIFVVGIFLWSITASTTPSADPRKITENIKVSTQKSAAENQKTLKVFVPYLPSNIHPLQTFSPLGGSYRQWIFQRPLILRNGVPSPQLALSWRWLGRSQRNKDGYIAEFNLNSNAKWSDGQPVNPEDFVFSLQVHQANEWQSLLRDSFASWIMKIEPKGNSKIWVYFSQDYEFQLYLFGLNFEVYPKHLWIKPPQNARDYLKYWSGSGPYKLNSFRPDRQMVLSFSYDSPLPSKNEFHLKETQFVSQPNLSDRWQNLKHYPFALTELSFKELLQLPILQQKLLTVASSARNSSAMRWLALSSLVQSAQSHLEKNSPHLLIWPDSLSGISIKLNHKHHLFATQEKRRVLYQKISPLPFSRLFFHNIFTPSQGLLPVGHPWFTPFSMQKPNIKSTGSQSNKQKSIIDPSLQEFEILLRHGQDQRVVDFLAQELKKHNVIMKVATVSDETYSKRLRQGNFDAYLWEGEHLSPFSSPRFFFHSKQMLTPQPWRFSQPVQQAIDQLCEKMDQTIDLNQRLQLGKDLFSILSSEMPEWPLLDRRQRFFLVSEGLKSSAAGKTATLSPFWTQLFGPQLESD